MEIVYYERNIWVLENNIWTNYSQVYGDERSIIDVIAYRTKMPKVHVKGKIIEAKVNRVDNIQKDVLMVFKNGYMNKELKFAPNIIPFTTSQITFDYKKKRKVHAEMDAYLDWFTNGDKQKRKSVLATATTLLTSRNEGTLGIFYSAKGGTGKTQMISLYKEMSRNAIKEISTETVFNHAGKFSLTGSKGKTGLIGDELPTTINKAATDRIKALIDPGKKYREVEDKGENSGETANIVNMIITTNRISTWYEVDNALKTRVNVVYINPDTTPEKIYPENKFFALRNDPTAIEYLLCESVDAYIEGYNTGLFRADKYRFGLGDTAKYWNQVNEEHSTTMDFMNYEYDGTTIKEMIEIKRIDFIPNGKLKDIYLDWTRVSKTKMPLIALKKDIVRWGSEKGYEVELNALCTRKGLTGRGLFIRMSAAVEEEQAKIKAQEQASLEKEAQYWTEREKQMIEAQTPEDYIPE